MASAYCTEMCSELECIPLVKLVTELPILLFWCTDDESNTSENDVAIWEYALFGATGTSGVWTTGNMSG